MSKNLYIDASHPNETRVVLKKDNHIEDYEYESVNNTLIKNNIYLGKVSRIELLFKQLLWTLEERGMDFCHSMIFNQTIINFHIVI